MAKGRRPFKRALGERRYRTLFVIATEGNKTEIQYFGIFNSEKSVIHVKCIRGKHRSAPEQVLNRMCRYLAQEGLLPSDQAWLVVDKDQWDDNWLNTLYQWSKQQANYGLAVTNPKFEYWLLLHFEDGDAIATPRECIDRLRHFLPDYDKVIDLIKVLPGIKNAVSRAKRHDTPPIDDWSKRTGTTVYRLVEQLMPAQSVPAHRQASP